MRQPSALPVSWLIAHSHGIYPNQHIYMYVFIYTLYAGQLAIIMRMLHCIVVAGFVSDPQSDKNCS